QRVAGLDHGRRGTIAEDVFEVVDVHVLVAAEQAVHALAATLGEARRRRKSVNRLLGGDEDMNVNDLEHILGDRATPAVIEARNALQDAAVSLSREVDLNKQVLRTAMDNGNDYVQKLFGASQPAAATYVGPLAPSASAIRPTTARLTPAMVPTAPRFLDRSV
ncbi:MAG TPA: hypothetical protein VE861_05635, partial [Gemmatimonadaceae bacterium]|nr:hypothetical protein [Gemmatimonadaceae bacterium]